MQNPLWMKAVGNFTEEISQGSQWKKGSVYKLMASTVLVTNSRITRFPSFIEILCKLGIQKLSDNYALAKASGYTQQEVTSL